METARLLFSQRWQRRCQLEARQFPNGSRVFQ
jgi:hypothetical protein